VVDNAVRVVPPAATDQNLRETFALAPGVPVCILPARFTEQKNHDGLLDTLTRVRTTLGASSPEVVCFGDGPLRAEAESAARRDDGRPLLRCFDFREDVDRWLGASTFFILPSLWEGQPLVVLEALTYGLAVATMTPVGVEDLVLDRRNGRHVSTASELADVIVEWTLNESARPRDDALTASILARHDIDVVCDAYERLYATVG
jgi:glycosyltransferase involved in cell wall biosynthesis